MAKKRIEGVSGVLGGLITPQPAVSITEPEHAVGHNEEAREGRSPAPASQRVNARRGRPPGRNATPPLKREKVTLRIDTTLIARYRERSWVERRQLCELVEEAMRAYRHNDRPKSTADAD